ncbi:MAG: MFS transporter [Gammaproteobacteria bacterium]|nr:MFS transporter [Gammaproteobacteria bacterium]MBT5153158.1 MFS transporter [Gammaproteobacteria bacterium]MBT5685973.1 MFS transporter [Gammaproteobacteria bacterium]MBT5722478.1 MFS transporter [Gammaproteobacteria bacterium]MBT6583128.1 MFS transporter [Gammaproteobacteria bacterium]
MTQSTETSAATSLTYAWYVVAVLLVAQAFSFLDRMIMGLLVGPIRESFQISDTQYSLLAGLAFSLFYAIMGLPLARIADRSSRRNLIVVGIAVWSFMTAACGLAKGYWSLFVARVGVGVGEATLGPAAYSMIADYFPKSVLGRALSVYMIGVTLGSGFAYMLGGAVVGYVEDMGTILVPVVGEIEGWQLTFFVVGFPGLLVSLLMLTTVREPARTGIVAPEAVPVSEVADYLWQRRRAYGGHILGISIFIMVVYALNLWGPTYFIRTFGYTRPEAGWVFGLVMIGAGTIGLLLAGTLSDRLVSKGIHDAYVKIILFSMVAMIPSAAALAFLESDLLAIVFMSLAVFFSAFQGGLAGGTLQLMTPNRMRGQVMAVYGLSSNLIGLGLGPTVIAMTTDYVFGYDEAIGKSIALCAVILCPIGAVILWRSLPAIGEQLAEQREKEGG